MTDEILELSVADLDAVSGGDVTQAVKTVVAAAENFALTVVDITAKALLHVSDGWV
jgi:hypothetical protein